MNQQNQLKTKSKIIVKIYKNDVDAKDSFFVPIARFSKVRKLQRKIKMLQGVREVDQTLLLLPSRRELQAEESLHSLLASDQNELKLCLTVDDTGKNKKLETATAVAQSIHEELRATCPLESVPSTVSIIDESKAESTLVSSIEEKLIPAKDDSDNIVTIVKLSFQEQHRRFPFEHRVGSASYVRLAEVCTQFFGVKNVHRMILSYQDEDGDRVQLSSDSELAYALENYAVKNSIVHQGLPVLKLSFNVKPTKKQEEDPAALNSSPAPVVAISSESVSASTEGKKLKSGDVVVLQAQRFGAVHNLSFSNKEQKVFAARHPFPDSKKVVGRKNAHWVVEKLDTSSGKAEGEEVFLLTNKSYAKNLENGKEKQTLRVLPNGKVNHKGGKGAWARFVVVTRPDGRVSLRSVGRSVRHPENNFLGIVKNTVANKASESEFLVAGDLKADSEDAQFTLQFVRNTAY